MNIIINKELNDKINKIIDETFENMHFDGGKRIDFDKRRTRTIIKEVLKEIGI